MELVEEKIILKNLITSDMYFAKVFPFLNEKLFSEKHTQKLFRAITEYNERYNRKPTLPVMNLFAEKVRGISDKEHIAIVETVEFFNKEEDYNFEWLCDKTLDFIHSRSYFEAIAEAGDLDIKGKRENIMLIRTNANGQREIHRLNLNDKEILLSPYFNLQQNDIIYVEPNKSAAYGAWQLSPAVGATITIVGGISAIASLIVGLANLLK